MIFESENIEFKLQMVDDIYKEVIAFANTDGGVIYVGIDDNGYAVGLDDVDETYNNYLIYIHHTCIDIHHS